ncbi:transcription factor IIIA [Folsomia candida]|uniref:Zinc finger protein ZXDC n=1 Tax=Folsomia candida TaxID=158441 RepID=A0A226ECK9_FOLCA|nr:transcription factor IIIA [Folsomia candida]OXA54426.1 Zinc finger protein ZXDC [Folsomia candida]
MDPAWSSASTKTLLRYVCFFCDKEYHTLRHNIERHLCKHLKERWHQCYVCKKRFLGQEELNTHKNQFGHKLQDKNYVCGEPYCDAAFDYLAAVYAHKEKKHWHATQDFYNCPIPGCHKSFEKLVNLRSHEQTHVKRHCCTWPGCDKKFVTPSQLRKHAGSHE